MNRARGLPTPIGRLHVNDLPTGAPPGLRRHHDHRIVTTRRGRSHVDHPRGGPHVNYARRRRLDIDHLRGRRTTRRLHVNHGSRRRADRRCLADDRPPRRLDRRADQGPGGRSDDGPLGPTIIIVAAHKRTGDSTENRPTCDRIGPRILSVGRARAGRRDCEREE